LRWNANPQSTWFGLPRLQSISSPLHSLSFLAATPLFFFLSFSLSQRINHGFVGGENHTSGTARWRTSCWGFSVKIVTVNHVCWCCSDVDSTILACIAFSCPNLAFLEISVSDPAVNRISRYYSCSFPFFIYLLSFSLERLSSRVCYLCKEKFEQVIVVWFSDTKWYITWIFTTFVFIYLSIFVLLYIIVSK